MLTQSIHAQDALTHDTPQTCLAIVMKHARARSVSLSRTILWCLEAVTWHAHELNVAATIVPSVRRVSAECIENNWPWTKLFGYAAFELRSGSRNSRRAVLTPSLTSAVTEAADCIAVVGSAGNSGSGDDGNAQ